MSKQDKELLNLVKELGKNYCIRTLDGEKCLYRDFKNGFNVEISGMHTSSAKKTATIYLWFGDTISNCLLVKQVQKVPRSKIGDVVEELRVFSEQLIAEGFDTIDKLYRVVVTAAKAM